MAMGEIAVIFLLVVSGIFIKKLGIITEKIYDELSNLLITVCMPAFILSAMNFSFSKNVVKNSIFLVVISFAVYMVSIILGEIVVRILGKTGAQRDVYQYICVFSNSGYMGYPVIGIIFGTKAVFYAAVYNLLFSALMWSYGVYVIRRSRYKVDSNSTKGVIISGIKSILNPSMVAVLIGFILFIFEIKLPSTIITAVNLIGQVTTPLAMMFIGFILSDIKVQDMFKDIADFIISAYRLLILPMIIYFMLKFVGVEGVRLIIPVMIAAMPASANTVMVASKYKSDVILASKIVFITTLSSVMTIPLIASIFG